MTALYMYSIIILVVLQQTILVCELSPSPYIDSLFQLDTWACDSERSSLSYSVAVHRAGTHRVSAVLSPPSGGSDGREGGRPAAVGSVSSSPLDRC